MKPKPKPTKLTKHHLLRIAGLSGVLIGWAAMYFFEDWSSPYFLTLICLAVVLGYGGAWGGLSSQWGAAPFTNDPLGWRKAKQSYQTEDPPKASADEPPADKP